MHQSLEASGLSIVSATEATRICLLPPSFFGAERMTSFVASRLLLQEVHDGRPGTVVPSCRVLVFCRMSSASRYDVHVGLSDTLSAVSAYASRSLADLAAGNSKKKSDLIRSDLFYAALWLRIEIDLLVHTLEHMFLIRADCRIDQVENLVSCRTSAQCR